MRTAPVLGIACASWAALLVGHQSAPGAMQTPASLASQASQDNTAQASAVKTAADERVRPARPRVASKSDAPTALEQGLAQLAAEIQEAIASADFAERRFALTNLLPALALKNASAAALLAESFTEPDVRREALCRVAQIWAALDSSRALAWAASLSDESERDTALTEVCLQLFQLNPAEAVLTRARFIAEDTPNLGLSALVQQWAGIDFAAAMTWVYDRAESEQRNGLIARLALVQSQTQPVDAFTLVMQQMSPGDAQNEAFISVLHQWATRDLNSAGTWIAALPAGSLRERAQRELAGIAEYR
jgi:hypothetical protein